MHDKLLISSKVKKTIIYIEKMTDNYPKLENVLKNKILDKSYYLLELVYKANIYKEISYMKEIIVNIRMIEYYVKKVMIKKLLLSKSMR